MKPALEVARGHLIRYHWVGFDVRDHHDQKELDELAIMIEQERAEAEQEALAGALALMKRAVCAMETLRPVHEGQCRGFLRGRYQELCEARDAIRTWITSHEAPAEEKPR